MGYAEREGLRPQGNVPNLRFPEFSGEWEEISLNDISTINPKSATLEDTFVYVDLEAVEKGVLKKKQLIQRSEAPSRAQRVIKEGDILFQCVRPYQKNNYLHRYYDGDNQWVASTGYAQIRTTECPNYLYHTLNTDEFNKKVMLRCTGSSYPAINSDDLSTIPFYSAPTKREQEKIAYLLDLIDERIATQNKIIDKLKSLIKGLAGALIGGCQGSECCLGDISKLYQPQTISSSKLTPEGFPVYGANGIIGHYTSYNHEYEQVCVTCRGNTCGTVNFTQRQAWITGNAMVINVDDNTSIDKRFLYYTLFITDFSSIISGSGQPQIVRAPLSKIKIVLPSKEEQIIISKTLDAISAKAEMEVNCLNILLCQKLYLLRSMFI